ncbi:ZIP zinc transporter-domain-containing protein [Truncatella angustata]|uniref:ZIP zinc transporter-domain-containing protein n=1 Tax=Truncatella angustata TaxID=152316 RepID=A0A9P8ZZ01_9PEZI|nr:ZIP zinc transporter-domain-containing protein [Truncatella angustata]KAH6654546.1 ZIP zinc transporter-domain-containing protein [Truncatella angustata]
MDTMEMSNDTRGWIMALVSGVACVLGASVICVDTLIRLLPGKKSFRIQDSDAFLASSLSLSFGVMIFMALYSMLPEAKSYLKKGGLKEQPAGFILIGCFIGGFVGIQVISRLFHRFLPSHVVDCDHSHKEQHEDEHDHVDGETQRRSSHVRDSDKHNHHHTENSLGENGPATESTPLLPSQSGHGRGRELSRPSIGTSNSMAESLTPHPARNRPATANRRPSMVQLITRRVSAFAVDSKTNCDADGPCHGFSDPCGQECFKAVSSRSSNHGNRSSTHLTRPPVFMRTTTGNSLTGGMQPVNEEIDEDIAPNQLCKSQRRISRARSRDPSQDLGQDQPALDDGASETSVDVEAQHHHHVPENAFLSIGLQTSIAIALHKLPEGFITYATNHANPSLGFSVFLALFVHNISEGFAMALPLYMALNNRAKAMGWSFLLGGLSQPFGAGIAVLWFKIAKHTHMTPNDVAYGCLFATTAGIMASVALSLFVESLSLNHNRNLSILFAFMGMALLGLSSAFAGHAH